MLEPHLTAARGRADDSRRTWPRSRTCSPRFVDALDDAEPREAGQLDADFHLAIYEASGSELLSVLRGYWTRLQLELSERVYNDRGAAPLPATST